MAKEIELQNGMKAIVDDEDYERVSQYNWTVATKGTTFNVVRKVNGKLQMLSHFILDSCLKDRMAVHKNKDTLDFRKDNLLLVKQEHIAQSRKGNRNSSSKYKGVSWDKRKKRWRANIKVNGKLTYLGMTKLEEDAAKLYNVAAMKYFGEHAYQNVLGEDNSADTFIIKESDMSRTRKHKKTSKYRGVYFDEPGWRAQCKGAYIGWYTTEIEAAKAYDEKAKELFGDKAILNSPGKWRAGNGLIKSGGAMLKTK